MNEYLDVEEACVKGRSGQFVHGDMDGDREEGATCLTCSPIFLGSYVGSLPLSTLMIIFGVVTYPTLF